MCQLFPQSCLLINCYSCSIGCPQYTAHGSILPIMHQYGKARFDIDSCEPPQPKYSINDTRYQTASSGEIFRVRNVSVTGGVKILIGDNTRTPMVSMFYAVITVLIPRGQKPGRLTSYPSISFGINVLTIFTWFFSKLPQQYFGGDRCL